MSSAGTYTLEIILNTVGAQWTVSAFINGTQIGTNIVYSPNPTIGFAGISQNSPGSGIQWNSWALSVTQVPAIATNYWVAPAAIGTGSGSSAGQRGLLSQLFFLEWRPEPASIRNCHSQLRNRRI